MTITQTSERVTCTNEATLTLSAIASAVSGMTSLGNGAYHLDRDIELINSDLTMLRETLVLTESYNTSTYNNGGSGRPAFRVDQNSSIDAEQSCISFSHSQNASGFIPFFGSDRSIYDEVGPIRFFECVFFMGDEPGDNASTFFRFTDEGNNYLYEVESCQFIGGDGVRGWGSFDGTNPSNVSKNNRSFGQATANVPFQTVEDNFAKDSDIYVQMNTKFTTDQRVVGAAGENLTDTVQVLLRSPNAERTMVLLDSELPRTFSNFSPQGVNGRIANLDWKYRHNATVLDALDGLPESGVTLDIVPTTTGGPSSTTNKTSDANGNFTETEVAHSRDRLEDRSSGGTLITNTQYGPFRIRYAKYEFIAQDRTGDPYDVVSVAENPRLLRDPTIVSTTAPSATRSITDLDELRDSWKLETIADLDLIDLVAGGGALNAGALDIIFDGNLTGNSIQRTGTTVRIKADGGVVAAGAVYGSLITTGTITAVDGAGVADDVILTDSSGSRVPVEVLVLDNATGLPVVGARVRLLTDPGGIEVLNQLTDINGEAKTTFVLSAGTLASGPVRKGTDSPRYVSTSVSGTITTAAGLSAVVGMVLDE